jgi:hypothetical protein
MSVAAPHHRPPAPPRRAAAYVLAALALVLAVLGASSDRWALPPTSSLPSLQALRLASPRLAAASRSTASPADPQRRDPRAGLVNDDADEKADLASRAPTPGSAVRPRIDGGWDGRLAAPLAGVDPASRRLALAATAALLHGASVARIAALHERAVDAPPPREPNPARGPPRSRSAC